MALHQPNDIKNQVSLFDSVVIIFLALLTNLFSEFLSWLLIYRKRKYKDCKKQIDILTKKVENAKESLKGKTKTVDKKIKQQETDLKSLNSDMMKIRMITTFIIGLFVVFFLSLFNNIYQGIVVAKLPFVPFGLLSSISHRGILSNDYTDCSFIFLYILSNFVMRPVIQKLLGFAAPRNNNQFGNFFAPQEN